MGFGTREGLIHSLHETIDRLKAENKDLVAERDDLMKQLSKAEKNKAEALSKLVVQIRELRNQLELAETRIGFVEKLSFQWQLKAREPGDLGPLHSYDKLSRIAILECISDLETALKLQTRKKKG